MARWTAAAAVTIAAFAAATSICGALVLPALKVHDPAVRWGIAGGLGVAVAALAALWGASYATAEPHQPQPGPTPGSASPVPPGPASSSGEDETNNDISGGTFQQPVIQGRDFGIVTVGKSQPTAPSPRPEDDNPTASGAPVGGMGGTRNTIRDGLFHGPVIQGRDFGTVNLNDSTRSADPAVPTDNQPERE
jgi:hypothetical protein